MSRLFLIVLIAVGLTGTVTLLWLHEREHLNRQARSHQPTVPLRMPRQLLDYARANRGPIDILLLGDSITQQWGSPLDTGTLNAAWKKRFGTYRTINLGVGGDRTEHVRWRLDQGAVTELGPRLVILMVGVNDLLFGREADVHKVAEDIRTCLAKVRRTFPRAKIIAAKILPAHGPDNKLDSDIRKTNAELDRLHLDSDHQVHVLDMTADFAEADGALKKSLFADTVHLSPEGYRVYAEKLQPLIAEALGGKAVGGEAARKKP